MVIVFNVKFGTNVGLAFEIGAAVTADRERSVSSGQGAGWLVGRYDSIIFSKMWKKLIFDIIFCTHDTMNHLSKIEVETVPHHFILRLLMSPLLSLAPLMGLTRTSRRWHGVLIVVVVLLLQMCSFHDFLKVCSSTLAHISSSLILTKTSPS